MRKFFLLLLFLLAVESCVSSRKKDIDIGDSEIGVGGGNPEKDVDLDKNKEDQFTMEAKDKAPEHSAGGLFFTVSNKLRDKIRVKLCEHPVFKKDEKKKDSCAIMPEATSIATNDTKSFYLNEEQLETLLKNQDQERFKKGKGAIIITVTRGLGHYVVCTKAPTPGSIVPQSQNGELISLTVKITRAPTPNHYNYVCSQEFH